MAGKGFSFGSKYMDLVTPSEIEPPAGRAAAEAAARSSAASSTPAAAQRKEGVSSAAQASASQLLLLPPPVIPSQCSDPELSQHVARLFKRDVRTRAKALQALRDSCSADAGLFAPAFSSFTALYARLALDDDRSVRVEAARTLKALLLAAQRAAGGALKQVLPPWWLACHEADAREVRAAHLEALEAVLPGSKTTQALILSFLTAVLHCAPSQLSLSRHDQPNELGERHSRALSSACAALDGLLTRLADGSEDKSQSAVDREALTAVRECVSETLARPGAAEALLKHSSASVRLSLASLLASAARRGCFCGSDSDALPRLVRDLALRLDDRDAAARLAVWGALVTLVQRARHEGASLEKLWSATPLSKALVPKLHALLRGAFDGGARDCGPALLPLLVCLPPALMDPEPAAALARSAWRGCRAAIGAPAQAAMQEALLECALYGLKLSLSGARGTLSLAQALLGETLVPAALGERLEGEETDPDTEASRAAAALLLKLLRRAPAAAQQPCARAVGLALRQAVERAPSQSDARAWSGLEHLATALLPLASDSAPNQLSKVLVNDVLRPLQCLLEPLLRSSATEESVARIYTLTVAACGGLEGAGSLDAVVGQLAACEPGSRRSSLAALAWSLMIQQPASLEQAFVRAAVALEQARASDGLLALVLVARAEVDSASGRQGGRGVGSDALDELALRLADQVAAGKDQATLGPPLKALRALMGPAAPGPSLISAAVAYSLADRAAALLEDEDRAWAPSTHALALLASESLATCELLDDPVGAEPALRLVEANLALTLASCVSGHEEGPEAANGDLQTALLGASPTTHGAALSRALLLAGPGPRAAALLSHAADALASAAGDASANGTLEALKTLTARVARCVPDEGSQRQEFVDQLLQAAGASLPAAELAAHVLRASGTGVAGERAARLALLLGGVVSLPGGSSRRRKPAGTQAFDASLLDWALLGVAEGPQTAWDFLQRVLGRAGQGSAEASALCRRFLSVALGSGDGDASLAAACACAQAARDGETRLALGGALWRGDPAVTEALWSERLREAGELDAVVEALCADVARASTVSAALPLVRAVLSLLPLPSAFGAPSSALSSALTNALLESDLAETLSAPSDVWYWDAARDGWVTARLDVLDRGVSPPVYGVLMGDGAFRIAERGRLCGRGAMGEMEPLHRPLVGGQPRVDSKHPGLALRPEALQSLQTAVQALGSALLPLFAEPIGDESASNTPDPESLALAARWVDLLDIGLVHSAAFLSDADRLLLSRLVARCSSAAAAHLLDLARPLHDEMTSAGAELASLTFDTPRALLLFFWSARGQALLQSSPAIATLSSFASTLLAASESQPFFDAALAAMRSMRALAFGAQSPLSAAALRDWMGRALGVVLGVGAVVGLAASVDGAASDAASAWLADSGAAAACVEACAAFGGWSGASEDVVQAALDVSQRPLAEAGLLVSAADALQTLFLDAKGWQGSTTAASSNTTAASSVAAVRLPQSVWRLLSRSQCLADCSARWLAFDDEEEVEEALLDQGASVALAARCGISPSVAFAALHHPSGETAARHLAAWSLVVQALDALEERGEESSAPAGCILRVLRGALPPALDAAWAVVSASRTRPGSAEAQQREPAVGRQAFPALQGGAATLPPSQSLRQDIPRAINELLSAVEPSALPLARAVFAGLLRTMSAGARDWYANLGARGVAREVAAYAAAAVSPRLAALEFERLERTRAAPHERFEVDWSAARRTITASMEIEAGQRMDLLFKLPPAFPLVAVSAECVRRLGASPQQVRRWLLGIEAFLRASRKSIADAVVSWRDNLDAKFEGLEDCLICYSILQPATGALPKKECRTCRKRFHGGCLYKWFNTSGQSTCPHCQSIW